MTTVAQESLQVKSDPNQLSQDDFDDIEAAIRRIAISDAKAIANSSYRLSIDQLADVAIAISFRRVREERAAFSKTLAVNVEDLAGEDYNLLFWRYVDRIGSERALTAKAMRS
jgi:hypothetical protein